MTENNPPPPQSPFTLNPTRILILVLGALAVTMIIGAISGGVANYAGLREARDAALSSSEAAASSAAN
ncbi:MAG: hypothetical protein ABL879_18430 [Devosia sp.]